MKNINIVLILDIELRKLEFKYIYCDDNIIKNDLENELNNLLYDQLYFESVFRFDVVIKDDLNL